MVPLGTSENKTSWQRIVATEDRFLIFQRGSMIARETALNLQAKASIVLASFLTMRIGPKMRTGPKRVQNQGLPRPKTPGKAQFDSFGIMSFDHSVVVLTDFKAP